MHKICIIVCIIVCTNMQRHMHNMNIMKVKNIKRCKIRYKKTIYTICKMI
jgi:hypothetical protein